MNEIKEKLLKDAFSWVFPHTYREINGDFNQYKLMNSASVYGVSTCIKKAIEETSKAKDEECCFEGCNKKAEKSLGNNLTPNLNMCKEHFDLFQKHTDAREDYFKRKKDEEFIKLLDKLIEWGDGRVKDNYIWKIGTCELNDNWIEKLEEIKQRIKEE